MVNEEDEMSGFIWVAFGGALGAVCRYAISLIPVKTTFPILTLVTNLIGAVLIGFIVGIVSSKQDVSANSVLFWKTGVCGGFTTFSTFSLEAFTLFENKAYVSGGIYIALSVLGCIAGVFIGKKLAMLFG
jgi:CrcB protein